MARQSHGQRKGKTQMNYPITAVITLSVLLLTSCGGGSGGEGNDSNAENPAPVVPASSTPPQTPGNTSTETLGNTPTETL